VKYGILRCHFVGEHWNNIAIPLLSSDEHSPEYIRLFDDWYPERVDDLETEDFTTGSFWNTAGSYWDSFQDFSRLNKQDIFLSTHHDIADLLRVPWFRTRTVCQGFIIRSVFEGLLHEREVKPTAVLAADPAYQWDAESRIARIAKAGPTASRSIALLIDKTGAGVIVVVLGVDAEGRAWCAMENGQKSVPRNDLVSVKWWKEKILSNCDGQRLPETAKVFYENLRRGPTHRFSSDTPGREFDAIVRVYDEDLGSPHMYSVEIWVRSLVQEPMETD
jgi:hypothetical protein